MSSSNTSNTSNTSNSQSSPGNVSNIIKYYYYGDPNQTNPDRRYNYNVDNRYDIDRRYYDDRNNWNWNIFSGYNRNPPPPPRDYYNRPLPPPPPPRQHLTAVNQQLYDDRYRYNRYNDRNNTYYYNDGYGYLYGGGFFGILLLILILIWIFSGITGFIASIVCLFYNGPVSDKVIGILLAMTLGPFYWLYYIYNMNYCTRY
jgi:hypothetical protein